jgi:hypothetical protein
MVPSPPDTERSSAAVSASTTRTGLIARESHPNFPSIRAVKKSLGMWLIPRLFHFEECKCGRSVPVSQCQKASVAPEIPEPCGRQFRVLDRVADISMAKPCLDCSRVVAGIGQCVTAGVAQHVRVNLDIELGSCAFDHSAKASCRERRPCPYSKLRMPEKLQDFFGFRSFK